MSGRDLRQQQQQQQHWVVQQLLCVCVYPPPPPQPPSQTDMPCHLLPPPPPPYLSVIFHSRDASLAYLKKSQDKKCSQKLVNIVKSWGVFWLFCRCYISGFFLHNLNCRLAIFGIFWLFLLLCVPGSPPPFHHHRLIPSFSAPNSLVMPRHPRQ